MIAAKEFKYWGGGNNTSQGYYAEADLDEFPKELREFARESLENNQEVYDFLAYLAIKRCYEKAVKEQTINGEAFEQLMEPFAQERLFEKGLPRFIKQMRANNNSLQIAAGG
jgi:predicted ATP-binding protein involved in virulence